MRKLIITLALISAVAVSACYSSDYARETAANVALLSDLADKLGDFTRSGFIIDGRALTSEEMGEFYYAFNKADTFASETPRENGLKSHHDFVELLNGYERFVHTADAYRLSGKPDPATVAALLTLRDSVKQLARVVMDDLHAEKK
ncbi:MAG TPA: hypothetical protein VMU16_09100 [Candidatus Binataceae bacterium]|nr:hypothetical protein [Candidatus Binataceae bacterium]